MKPLEPLQRVVLLGEDSAEEDNPKAIHCHKEGCASLAGSVTYKATVAIRW